MIRLPLRFQCDGRFRVHASFPRAKKFYPILHPLSRAAGDQFQKAAHLFADRVVLLLGEDNAAVRPALRKKFRVQAVEVPDVEAVERAALRGRQE
jgi:hypothetical protein